jgi:hypothetical protein
MRIGMRLGLVWVSARSGRKRRRAHPNALYWWALPVLIGIFGASWIGAAAAAWIMWIGIPLLLVAELIYRASKRKTP